MKDIWGFFQWQWAKFDTWQRFYIASAGLFGAGIVADGPISYVLIGLPTAIVVLSTLKWFLWDSLVRSWKDYKKEKSQLLDIIKESDSAR
jgi:hypothetical protein